MEFRYHAISQPRWFAPCGQYIGTNMQYSTGVAHGRQYPKSVQEHIHSCDRCYSHGLALLMGRSKWDANHWADAHSGQRLSLVINELHDYWRSNSCFINTHVELQHLEHHGQG